MSHHQDKFEDHHTEREIIGNIINDHTAYMDVFDTLRPDHFAGKMGDVYRVYAEQIHKKEPVDLQTLSVLAGVSVGTLAECAEEGWMSANVKAKAHKVISMAHKRHTYRDCRKLVAEMQGLSSPEIAKRLSDMAAAVAMNSQTKHIYDGAQLAAKVTKNMERRHDNKGKMDGIMSGYRHLDLVLRGLRPKRMTVVAAATGFGKSTLALNLLSNVVRLGHKALFLSNENDVDDNLDRLHGIETGLELKAIEKASEEVWGPTSQFAGALFHSGLFLSDNSPRSIDEVVGTISRYVVQHGVEIVFVDYIGEILTNADTRETEEARLARFAQRLVDCSKSMGIHIVVMAQLNRQGNAKGRPTKSELASCFKIAMKAHSVLLFWQNEEKQDILTIDKNRQGPPNVDLLMDYNRANQRIEVKGFLGQ
jgi:replicative DNA helicase